MRYLASFTSHNASQPNTVRGLDPAHLRRVDRKKPVTWARPDNVRDESEELAGPEIPALPLNVGRRPKTFLPCGEITYRAYVPIAAYTAADRRRKHFINLRICRVLFGGDFGCAKPAGLRL